VVAQWVPAFAGMSVYGVCRRLSRPKGRESGWRQSVYLAAVQLPQAHG